MQTNVIFNISRELTNLRRQLRDNDLRLYMLMLERQSLQADYEAVQIRYQYALCTPRLHEQGAAAVAAAVEWLGGE